VDKVLQDALAAKLLALADDELILAHRNSEWTGHAPILEEDIAFANIAQDEMGHAAIWLGLFATLTGRDPDQVIFFRPPEAYRNVQLVELPKGDWALSMVRQYLFDAYELAFLAQLVASAYTPLAEAAAKIRPEELYHYRHSSTWVRRLALGTAESHRRTQAALDSLWSHAQQLFMPLPDEPALVAAGYLPDPALTQQSWQAAVQPFLRECALTIPQIATGAPPGREKHTPHLTALLAELQEVARLDPTASW
jgi:ring-1,2-phenylacetyl-CoA epoxidase subunit PaaC